MARLQRFHEAIWGACLALLLGLLAACGGGGSGPAPVTGSLTVSVTGLPASVSGNVAVSGPAGFTQTIGSTQTLRNLAAGTYTVSASNVLSGANIFAPQQITQNIVVSAGATPIVPVAYANAGALRLALQPVATGLISPLFLTAPPGDPRLFIVERAGRIRILQNGTLLATPFLDISSRVGTAGEGGLLSIAFDPQYASNGFFFVYFTEVSGDIAIERFRVLAGDANTADPAPLRILTIAHRSFTNHKGGLAAFGPDGFLYIGTGDGGGSGDPQGNGQNLNTLLGKLLRIDVSGASPAQPYAIPPLNPFAGQVNRRGEIWAYGLRNPWRYSFDVAASLLFIGDVGQDRVEEVDVAGAATAGLNFGWNVTEGSLCYPADPCSNQGITLPVLEYGHDVSGGCSVVGGYVYRGSAIPELRGRYLYSDFCSGWLRSFLYAGGTALEQVDWNIPNPGRIFSFGEDAQRELYLLASSGIVYRIVRQ